MRIVPSVPLNLGNGHAPPTLSCGGVALGEGRPGVKIVGVFNLFGRRRSKSSIKPPRAPGDTIRPHDLKALQEWVAGRAFVEAFVEPETMINEMSVVLVDETGDHTRRKIGGPKGIDEVVKALDIPVYDVEETGYPERMRKRIERDRIIRKRREQRERREKFERGENPFS